MDRSGSHDHGLRSHVSCVRCNARLNAARYPAFDDDAAYVTPHHDPCALRGRVLEVGDQRRLLRPTAASHTAAATGIVSRAAAYVTRQESGLPTQLCEAATQGL